MSLLSTTLVLLQLLYLGGSVTTKIISTHANQLGPDPCALVCSGTSGDKTTNWRTWDRDTVYVNVDMAACGFTYIPTVTTTLSVAAVSQRITGISQVAYVGTGGFRIYLDGFVDRAGDITAKYAKDRDYAVNWLAVGFNC